MKTIFSKSMGFNLNKACYYGSVKDVKTLLKRKFIFYKANINYFDKSYPFFSIPPLSQACDRGHFDIVKLLVEKGAEINYNMVVNDSRDPECIIENRMCPPIFYAIKSGHKDIVEFLIEKGANINKTWGDPLLQTAIKSGNIEIVKLLIEKGASMDIKIDERTPLAYANYLHNTEIVKLLVDMGVSESPDATNYAEAWEDYKDNIKINPNISDNDVTSCQFLLIFRNASHADRVMFKLLQVYPSLMNLEEGNDSEGYYVSYKTDSLTLREAKDFMNNLVQLECVINSASIK